MEEGKLFRDVRLGFQLSVPALGGCRVELALEPSGLSDEHRQLLELAARKLLDFLGDTLGKVVRAGRFFGDRCKRVIFLKRKLF